MLFYINLLILGAFFHGVFYGIISIFNYMKGRSGIKYYRDQAAFLSIICVWMFVCIFPNFGVNTACKWAGGTEYIVNQGCIVKDAK